MTDYWYPVTSQHPPALVQVRAIIDVKGAYDAEVIASRGAPPHTNIWAEWQAGRAKPLAPGSVPILWRPQAPEKWKAPLPPPVSEVREGRVWSSTTRFALVDEAEAAELAAEMERDREDARRGGAIEVVRKEGLPWWRDADQIRYEPAGQITPRMCEGRLMRAVAMCEHGRGLTLRIRSFGTILAQMAARLEQQEYATSDFVPRLKPLPADISDFEIAMSWFVAINPAPLPEPGSRAAWVPSRPQEVLLFRARNIPLSFEEIGARVEWNVTKQAVHRMYDRAIRRACRIANGAKIEGVDQIAELQERNRAWKRKGHDPVSIQAGAIDALDRGAA